MIHSLSATNLTRTSSSCMQFPNVPCLLSARGEPLAPVLLQPLLSIPIPHQPELDGLPIAGRQLCDLTADVWQQFPHAACVELGQAIVRQVHQSSYVLARDHACITLPRPPRALAVTDLALEVRSTNALIAYFGPLPLEPETWAKVSLKTLMGIPGFGAKSLVDFLCSYQSFCHCESEATVSETAETESVSGEHEQLLRWATDPSCPASKYLLQLNLPALPGDWAVRSLQLQNRTVNALRRNGLDRDAAALSNLTLGQLLALPGFGEQSGKDLVATMLQDPAQDAHAVLPPAKTLDEELRQMIAHSLPRVDPRTIAIALRYLGLDGKGGGTMQEVGDAFGISRERVRQIVERAAHAVGNRNWDAPMLKRVLSAAAQQMPRPARDVEFELRQEGLIAEPISLDRVALVADLVGHKRTWGLAQVAGEAVVVPAHEESTRHPTMSWQRSLSNRENSPSRA